MTAKVKKPEQRLLLMLLADETSCDGIGSMDWSMLVDRSAMRPKRILAALRELQDLDLISMRSTGRDGVSVWFNGISDRIREECGL